MKWLAPLPFVIVTICVVQDPRAGVVFACGWFASMAWDYFASKEKKP